MFKEHINWRSLKLGRDYQWINKITQISYAQVKSQKQVKQYFVDVSNTCAALEDLEAEVEIDSDWETIKENKQNCSGYRTQVK
jgi:hypothetical protein